VPVSDIERKAGRRIITPSFIADMMKDIKIRHHKLQRINMSAVDYADIRKFDKGYLDTEINLSTGLMGYVFGVSVYIMRGILCGKMILMTEDSQKWYYCFPEDSQKWYYCFPLWHEPKLSREYCDEQTCVITGIMES
jgi:hypothetical protein